jgi:hypothetical protein
MHALVAGIHVLPPGIKGKRGWHRKSGLPDFRIKTSRKSDTSDLR